MLKNNISAILSLVIAALLLFIFVQNSCTRDNKPAKDIEVVIPEKEVKPNTPTVIQEVVDTFYVDNIKYLPSPQKPDTTLLNAYKRENDSLKKLSMYEKAVTKRAYTSKYDDANVNLEFYAEATGTLDKLTVTKYTVKEQHITIDGPKVKSFAVYVGAELSLPLELNTLPSGTAKAYIQNKGMMYSAGYDPFTKTAIAGLAIKL